MTLHCTATYEGGLLRPDAPLNLPEGSHVEVVLVLQPPNGGRTPNPAEILAEIAALPTSGGDPGTSRDHDQVGSRVSCPTTCLALAT